MTIKTLIIEKLSKRRANLLIDGGEAAKVKAFDKAIQTLQELDERELIKHCEQDTIEYLPGIGIRLAAIIRDIIKETEKKGNTILDIKPIQLKTISEIRERIKENQAEIFNLPPSEDLYKINLYLHVNGVKATVKKEKDKYTILVNT